MNEPRGSASSRQVELAYRLSVVEERVAAACADAGRARDEVVLVVVTKFFPASDVRLLLDLGVRDIGESRAQEATDKFADALLGAESDPSRVGGGARLATHFIGQVQTNKAAAVVGWADVVHAVDRPKLVRALDRAAGAAGKRPRVLVQVALDGGDADDAGSSDAGGGDGGGDGGGGDGGGGGGGGSRSAGRAGLLPEDARGLADQIAGCDHLRLGGVMAVAPLGADPDVAFGLLAKVAQGIRGDHADATWISAGMSGDLEAAVRHGATHLRVGTAILGSRPSLR
ncbi:MAG: alanine racemase [Lapillicoccus sp.]